MLMQVPSTQAVATFIQIDEFCIKIDGFCIKNDGFCIQNDGFNKNGQEPREASSLQTSAICNR